MEEYEKPRSQIRRFVYAGFDTLYIVRVHAAYRRREQHELYIHTLHRKTAKMSNVSNTQVFVSRNADQSE